MWLPPLEVTIDLKPGNADNAVDPFNLGSNKPVEVAVFSTPEFDATTVDPGTVRLGDPGLPGALGMLDAAPVDVNGDGLLDALLYFGPARDFGDAGALDDLSVEILLTADTFGGAAPIFGTDTITIVGGN